MTLCSIWACRLRFAHAAGHGSGLPPCRTAMIIRCVPFVFSLTQPRGCHIHHRQGRVYGGEDLAYNLEWLHPNCHRQVHRQGISVDQAASPVEEAFAKA
jgi:hypothetical protein